MVQMIRKSDSQAVLKRCFESLLFYCDWGGSSDPRLVRKTVTGF